jgi:hypothetical protein
MIPRGAFSIHGSASHWSDVAATALSLRAMVSTATVVFDFASALLSVGLLHSAAAVRQIFLALSRTARVFSVAHRAPVQESHFPHIET